MKKSARKKFFRSPAVPRSFTTEPSNYGYLDLLNGKWYGDKGWNIVTVPDMHSTNKRDFTILIRPYTENMEFTKVSGNVPNRGANKVQQNFAYKYDLSINDREDASVHLHAENGMFIRQTEEGPGEGKYLRQSIIPHGNSLLAMGGAKPSEKETPNPIPPNLDALNDIFKIDPTVINGAALGYQETFDSQLATVKEDLKDIIGNFDPKKPISFLRDVTQSQKIINTVTSDLSTNTKGGIVNSAYINENANVKDVEDAGEVFPAFRSIFWIQNARTAQGLKITQLQYAQVVSIFFPDSDSDRIIWPHVSINTLVKVGE